MQEFRSSDLGSSQRADAKAVPVWTGKSWQNKNPLWSPLTRGRDELVPLTRGRQGVADLKKQRYDRPGLTNRPGHPSGAGKTCQNRNLLTAQKAAGNPGSALYSSMDRARDPPCIGS